MLMDYFSKSIY